MLSPSLLKIAIPLLSIAAIAIYILSLNHKLTKVKSQLQIVTIEKQNLLASLDSFEKQMSILTNRLKNERQRNKTLSNAKQQIKQKAQKERDNLEERLAKVRDDNSHLLKGKCYRIDPALSDSFNLIRIN